MSARDPAQGLLSRDARGCYFHFGFLGLASAAAASIGFND